MGLKFTRINMGGPNKDFGFQLCLMERPMIEVKSVTLHQFHFLHKTELAKVHQRDMFELTTQVNAMLSILNRNGFVLEKKDLNDLTISLLVDGTIISSTGLFTNSMSYISFKDIIRSIKSDFPEIVCYNVVGQLTIYLDYMKSKPQQMYKLNTLKTQALHFLSLGDFLSDEVKWKYKKKAEKPKIYLSCYGEPKEGRTSSIVSKYNPVLPDIGTFKTYVFEPDNPGQLTGQVDDFPKIDGVWMGKGKLGSSQKKKMQVGSIVLHFTRVVDSDREKYRLDKIEGAYMKSQLPEVYLLGSPHVYLQHCYTSKVPLPISSHLTTPNGSMLFETGKVYTQNFLIAKLQYLVKAGQRLRDIKREQVEKEKEKEDTWKGSFIVQV